MKSEGLDVVREAHSDSGDKASVSIVNVCGFFLASVYFRLYLASNQGLTKGGQLSAALLHLRT